jgi:hypothetical protein
MRRNFGLLALTVSLLGTGCQANDEFANASPQTSAYQLELTGDSTEGLSTQSADWGAATQALGVQPPEYLGHTQDAIRALNQAVAAVLDPAADAVAANAGKLQTGDTRNFGPVDKNGATFLFTMTKAADKTFGWLLQAKPIGGADSQYVKVMGGLFHAGDQPHLGEGIIGADLDKLASVDSQFHGNGQMLVGFAHVQGFKILTYALHQFSPDVTQFDPVDAVFWGWKGPLGEAHVKLALYANLADTATAAKELLLLHARWLPGVGGRADALALGGDVPQGSVIAVNACWDRDGSDVDGFLLVRQCTGSPAGVGCTVLKTAGSPANCKLDDEELPAQDPMDATQDPGAPQTTTPPTSMP